MRKALSTTVIALAVSSSVMSLAQDSWEIDSATSCEDLREELSQASAELIDLTQRYTRCVAHLQELEYKHSAIGVIEQTTKMSASSFGDGKAIDEYQSDVNRGRVCESVVENYDSEKDQLERKIDQLGSDADRVCSY